MQTPNKNILTTSDPSKLSGMEARQLVFEHIRVATVAAIEYELFLAEQQLEAGEISKELYQLKIDLALDELSLFNEPGQVALKPFCNVAELMNDLSSIGLGPMRKWWTDEIEWMSASNNFDVSSPGSNTPHNYLALYLSSESEHYVRTLKLNLTIHNRIDSGSACFFLAQIVPKLFQAIKQSVPPGLCEAILTQTEFWYMTNAYIIGTEWENGIKSASYSIIISSK
ncbi:hypothetical protein [Larkinella terrae]|uniref:Uncharacterized protein n=1 Tax=Larkinella terrae TaxID=2025311 RepID=A0A7K0EEG9_9BACT|nr:hypothetical protein [Larkinella terrae]MRS59858.1 hypothetical protein [Larkinella terrae]